MLLKSLIELSDPAGNVKWTSCGPGKMEPAPETDINVSLKAGGDVLVEMPSLPHPFLSPMLEVEDKKPVESRLSEKTNHLHVSSLLDLCPRQYALTRHQKLKLTEKVNSATRIVWEIGKSLEKYAIKNIENYHGVDLVCSEDIVIFNDEYGIQGAPDVLVWVDKSTTIGDTVVVCEIKTMNSRDFSKLEEARGDHILQAALYRWLLEQEDMYNPHDNVILLYIAKDYVRNQSPYKEFQVDTNEPHIRKGVDIALELALEYKNAREKRMIPARKICNREDCGRALQCPVSEACFSNPEEEYFLYG